MMRACWVDAGSNTDYGKFAANRITWPYFDIREPQLNATYLTDVKNHPNIDGVGFYVVRSWFPQYTPPQLAEYTDQRLKDIGYTGVSPVMFDIEGSAIVPYILSCLTRWRQLRPTKTTDLTIEGHQGGLFTRAQAQSTAKMIRYCVPQCYDAPMAHGWDPYAMTVDLTTAGFPLKKVCPFLDAAKLSDYEWWGIPAGFAFIQGRLS